ncbi:unnamed protein product [Rhizoctonia solani]|uniref:Uncharacterized protein n=1 Tax=Rhizoctonia solani TaxID=456999 RepID=A0A8H3B0W4_9AGAM|nr:unnamed protein product [Rhizoctonia solani]
MVCDDNVELGQATSFTHQPHNILDQEAHEEHEVRGGVILRGGPTDEPGYAAKISFPLRSSLHGSVGLGEVRYMDTVDTTEPSQFSRGLKSFATNVYRYFCPPTFMPAAHEQGDNNTAVKKVRMEEKLSTEEAEKDNIKANMFTWGACHQRQKALEGDEGGYFTSSFVTAVKEVQGASTVGELFDNVKCVYEHWIKVYIAEFILWVSRLSAKVEEMMRNNMKKSENPQDEKGVVDNDPAKTEGANPQYIQLWTSLGGGTEDSACSKLNDPFDI